MSTRPTHPLVRDVVRVLARRRWLVASGLLAGAVAVALPTLAPPPMPVTDVLAAAHDLSAGSILLAEDVVTRAVPEGAVPDGVLLREAAVGRVLAGAVRSGETLTDVRMVGPALLAGAGDGLVGVPVRLADPAATQLLRVGDRVDVLAASTDPDAPVTAAVVAASVLVLAVPARTAELDGALVLVAAPAQTAARLAAAEVSSRLSVLVRQP